MRRTLTRRLSRDLLSGGLLQLLLQILLASSLSSSTTLSSSVPFPISILLLLELGSVLSSFNRTELVCSLLVLLAVASPGICLPGGPHCFYDILKGQIWICILLEGEKLNDGFHC